MRGNEEGSWEGSSDEALGAGATVQLTFQGAHVAQVDLGDGELAHVTGQHKLAAGVQVLLLDAREPFHHLGCDLACVFVIGQ